MIHVASIRAISNGATIVDQKHWIEVLEYLKIQKSSNSLKEIEDFKALVLLHNPSSISLAEAILEQEVSLKNRTNLNQLFAKLFEANNCLDLPQNPTCLHLRLIWKDRLSQLLFYDASATLLERSRRALLAKDCRSAQAALEELEAREGIFLFLAQNKVQVAKCFNDRQARGRAEKEVERLNY